MRNWFYPSVRARMGCDEGKRRLRSRQRLLVQELENRSVPSAVALSHPRPVAGSDWADTDGNPPVTMTVVANDYAAPPLTGGTPTTLDPTSVRIASAPRHGKAV